MINKEIETHTKNQENKKLQRKNANEENIKLQNENENKKQEIKKMSPFELILICILFILLFSNYSIA